MGDPEFDVKAEVQKAIEHFRQEFKNRSFAGRHPELGKMIKCGVCNRRHRSSEVCHQRFAKERVKHQHLIRSGELTPPEGLTELTKFQVLGRATFAKKRAKPHYSKKRLQLVQRTIELYPLHEGIWPSTETKSAEMVAMQVARREARAELEKKRHNKRSALQDIQHRSRKINRV